MRLVIFDWEGTLIKSLQEQFDCLALSARRIGISLTPKYTLFSSPWHFLDSPVNGLGPVKASQLKHALSMTLDEIVTLSADTEAVLHALKQKGLHIAVATNLNRQALDVALGKNRC